MDTKDPVVLCRFGDGNRAAARYATPNGCACFPDDRVQDLCGQHIIKGGMLDGAERVKVYDQGFFDLFPRYDW